MIVPKKGSTPVQRKRSLFQRKLKKLKKTEEVDGSASNGNGDNSSRARSDDVEVRRMVSMIEEEDDGSTSSLESSESSQSRKERRRRQRRKKQKSRRRRKRESWGDDFDKVNEIGVTKALVEKPNGRYLMILHIDLGIVSTGFGCLLCTDVQAGAAADVPG